MKNIAQERKLLERKKGEVVEKLLVARSVPIVLILIQMKIGKRLQKRSEGLQLRKAKELLRKAKELLVQNRREE